MEGVIIKSTGSWYSVRLRDGKEVKARLPGRFKLENKTIEWNDLIKGKVSFESKNLSDPVLIREDETLLYHLPSVIDDIEEGVSEIIRGEDHISNTAFHIQIFEALNSTIPTFGHHPFLTDENGKGFGKSHSKRGAIMSLEISERLQIDKDSKELIEFLILEHLTMSSFSQKRDLDDDELIHQFKNRIKTIERLEYLFILTFCDLRSVAPAVWSDWKGSLLQTLFKKTIGLMSKKQTFNKESKHKIYE